MVLSLNICKFSSSFFLASSLILASSSVYFLVISAFFLSYSSFNLVSIFCSFLKTSVSNLYCDSSNSNSASFPSFNTLVLSIIASRNAVFCSSKAWACPSIISFIVASSYFPNFKNSFSIGSKSFTPFSNNCFAKGNTLATAVGSVNNEGLS